MCLRGAGRGAGQLQTHRSEVPQPERQEQVRLLWPLWPWAGHPISLSLSYSFCNLGEHVIPGFRWSGRRWGRSGAVLILSKCERR